MRITKQQLRKMIKESLMLENSSKLAKELLDRDYEIVTQDTRYPYGRNRGDVRSQVVYARKDGQPVPESDITLMKDRDAEVRKEGGSWAALAGVYTSKLSSDGLSIVVDYYRHTAG
tara:strand:- start:115 stop:462 length:348 start_codon:yes stop_codon:yes gene_type:complete